jgi:ParB-like chromosome segregation protein Spo0J
MSETAAEWVQIAQLVPWAENPRDNDDAAKEVAKSIKRFGWGAPIVARAEDNMVIAGHTRLKAASLLGMDTVPVRFVDLSPVDARLLALADNKVGELAEWSDGLADVMRALQDQGAELDGLGWDGDELAGLFDEEPEEESAYTGKIDSPVYEVTGERPSENELYDADRTKSLTQDILDADLPDEVRDFLLAATGRHTAFRYDKIAEYYAHASAEVQRLMEDSALVIVDFDRAVELGFVALGEELSALWDADHGE